MKPKGPIRVRMYDVGFGDCFLLSVPYVDGDRHVLIDFGTMAGAAAGHMGKVAADIKKECGGKLTAIVATHRHQDHISGFATRKDGKGTGDLIASLNPDLVVQPWTEHPDAKPDAKAPPAKKNAIRKAIETLDNAQASLLPIVKKLSATRSASTRLKYLAINNLKNASAVENLMRMGKGPGAQAEYVSAGYKTALNKLLPGVTVHVLGPPTLEQKDDLDTQAKKHSEFWMLRASSTLPKLSARIGGKKRNLSIPLHARWLRDRLKRLENEELHGIVSALDDAMNNTSVILVFEADGQKLLFSGDAQIENWEFALGNKENLKLLSGVTTYKVGHHGSRNATPKTLWKLFKRRRSEGGAGLVSLMSTQPKVHGETANNSEVPRETLVDELKRGGTLNSTESFRGKALAKTF